MAGKKKKKDKKKTSGPLSHIGAHLVPSAIFAAASPSLASTWPRRSASPISKAVGEAGLVGSAFMGDMNRTYSEGAEQLSPVRRAPANLPSVPPVEESSYESVEGGPDYDRTTKYAMVNGDDEDTAGPVKHSYHVLADKTGSEFKQEPVYAKVDKSKKKSARQAKDTGNDTNIYDDVPDDVSIAISSDDDLTDVTSNDEESSYTASVKRNSRHSQKEKKPKPLKVQRQSNEESVSEEQSHHENSEVVLESPRSENVDSEPKKKNSKRSLHLSKKRNSIDTTDGMSNEQQNNDGLGNGKTSPTESPYGPSGVKRGSKKSSLKKRFQVAPEEEQDSSSNTKTVSQERQLERLGFEGTSQKVELSDISEDEEAFALRSYHPLKHSDKKTRRKVVNEEIQMMESEPVVEGTPNSFFDEKPEDTQRQLRRDQSSVSNESTDKSVFFLNEQKKQLEHLIRQQEDVYRQQAQQQKEQQAQAVQLAQQQLELQKQLQHLEQIQNERLNSSTGNSISQDNSLPKDVVEQQENFFRLQQQQQAKYENQQERVLRQQQNICDQIKQLEYQQKQLQSNLSMLSPKETDLAEIRWQEKEIIRLLNEQQSHQANYDKLHKLQQNQLEEQAALFKQERKALEAQQESLLTKIKEQEEKSKKLEIELQSISAKPIKKVRHSKIRQESEDDITTSQIDEVDAIPVSHTQRSHKKNRKPTKSPVSSSIDMLTLENSRLSDLNVSLQKENQVLRQFTETVERGTGGESLVTQQYIKDLQHENKVLQDTVHRLNVELSRYQMKYRQATVEEVDSLIFPKSTGSCPWLVNTKFLAPLFVAYDDRLKEKDDIIKVYDEEISAFKARLMEIVKENQDLHMRIAKSKPDALVLDEWQQLQEQAKLVVEENSILMKQQDLQQRKIKEMHQVHGQDVSKLSMRITRLESEKKTLQTELEDSHCSHAALLQKYETLLTQEDKKIPIEEHLAIMDECRSIMEDMKANKESESEQVETKIEAINQEKQNLVLSLTDCKAQVSQLTKELEIHRKTQRKLERKNLLVERKLEHILEREVTAQQTLDAVLKIAEKTAEERDSFEEFAKTQEIKQKKTKSMIHQGDLSILGLKEKLKSNKRKSSEKVALIAGQLNDKEKEVNNIKAEHQKEINRLRQLVREKQKAMEEMMGERRMFDQQLDQVWQKADQETQQMKKSIQEDHNAGKPGHV